jgi:hypothetical protein
MKRLRKPVYSLVGLECGPCIVTVCPWVILGCSANNKSLRSDQELIGHPLSSEPHVVSRLSERGLKANHISRLTLLFLSVYSPLQKLHALRLVCVPIQGNSLRVSSVLGKSPLNPDCVSMKYSRFWVLTIVTGDAVNSGRSLPVFRLVAMSP